MRKTLVLDLDETLIHSCSLKENPMHVLKTVGEFGEETSVIIIFQKFPLKANSLNSYFPDRTECPPLLP